MSTTDVDPNAMPPELPPGAVAASMPAAPPWNPSVDLSTLSQSGRASGEVDPGAYAVPAPQQQVPAGVDINRLSREAANIQRDQARDTAVLDAEKERALTRDRARLEEQYKASGIGPDDLKPWDADAAKEKYRHDPIQEFGSIGSVFAMVASAFTNRPMENAMMGSAAAINAAREGKATEFDRAYKAWQDNTKLAIDRQKIQSQQFSHAFTLLNTDMALGVERAKALATQYGYKQMGLLLDNGLYKEAIDLNDKVTRLSMHQAENLPKVALENMKMSDLKARTDGLQPGTPEYQKAVQSYNQTWSSVKQTAGDKFLAAADAEYRGPEADGPYSDYLKTKWGEFQKEAEDTSTRKMSAAEKQFESEIEEKEGRKPTSQEWTAFHVAQRGSPTKPRQFDAVTQTYVNEVRSEGREPTSQELVEFGQKRKTALSNVERKLSSDDVTFMAQQALRGDNSVFTNLGRGAQGAENVIAVRRRIRELAGEKNLTGADVALQNAEYQGLRAAMRVAGSREAIIGVAANEAVNMMDVAKDAAAKVPRTRWVPINQLAQYVGRQASYPELAAFAQANESLVNGYVRAISPTGVPTDLVRKHAYNALTTAQGPDAYAAVLDIMKKEMYAALSAPDQVRMQLITREKKIREGDHSPLFDIGVKSDSNIIKYDNNGNRMP